MGKKRDIANKQLLESMTAMGRSNGPYEDWRISEKNPSYETAVDLAECARQIKLAQGAVTMNDLKGAAVIVKRVQEALVVMAESLGKKDKSAE